MKEENVNIYKYVIKVFAMEKVCFKDLKDYVINIQEKADWKKIIKWKLGIVKELFESRYK